MRINSIITKIVLLFLLVFTMSSFVFASTINLTYYLDDDLFYNTTVSTNDIADVILPENTIFSLQIDIPAANGTFSVYIPKINSSKPLNFSTRNINISDITTSEHDIGTTYISLFAHALEIISYDEFSPQIFKVTINNSISNDKKYHVKQFDFNFTTNTSNFSTQRHDFIQDSELIFNSKNSVSFYTPLLSSFILTYDTTTVSDPYVPSGSSSGGGGGGSSSPSNVYVIVPSYDGYVISAKQGSTFDILHGDSEYMIDYSFERTNYVVLEDTKNNLRYELYESIPSSLDLDLDGKADVIISVGPSVKNSRSFVFQKIKTSSFNPAILPPGSVDRDITPETQNLPTGNVVNPPTNNNDYGNYNAPVVEPVEEVPVLPKNPLSFSTFIVGLLFILVLVGGVAGYRKYYNTEINEPPAVVRADLDSPQQSSRSVSSLPTEELIMPTSLNNVKKAINVEQNKSFKQSVGVKSLAVDIGNKHYNLSAKMVESIDSFIHVGLAKGYSSDNLKSALIKKGWPAPLISYMLAHADFAHNEVSKGVPDTPDSVVVFDDPSVVAVKKLLLKGFDKEHIKSGLLRKGWTPKQIELVFSRL